jgi:hypothetical protein
MPKANRLQMLNVDDFTQRTLDNRRSVATRRGGGGANCSRTHRTYDFLDFLLVGRVAEDVTHSKHNTCFIDGIDDRLAITGRNCHGFFQQNVVALPGKRHSGRCVHAVL